jgi:hypothetical protein
MLPERKGKSLVLVLCLAVVVSCCRVLCRVVLSCCVFVVPSVALVVDRWSLVVGRDLPKITIQTMARSVVVGIKGVLVCLLALLPVVHCEIRPFNLLLEPVVRKNDAKGVQATVELPSSKPVS